MKLEKYIKQLLLENEMVIVPGFGAFISEYLPAVVDDESGEIKPPSSQLIFNPKIKNNDGLLVGQVAEATRCTHFEALQKIEKERDNIIYQLDKGEKVELEDLGTLLYNADNQVVLAAKEDAGMSLDTFGLDTTHFEETPVDEISEVAEEAFVTTENEAVMEESTEERYEENEPDQEPEIPVLTEEPIAEEIVAEPVIAKKPQEKKKSKAGWIWLLLVMIPLLAVSVFLLTKKDKPTEPVQTLIQAEPEPIAVDSAPATDSSLVDSLAIQKTDTLKVVEEPRQGKTVEIENGKFYLVGGSFKSEENAETFLQALRDKGFEPFHMGKYGSFFIVGIGSYDSEGQAMTARDEYLEQNPGSGVWILER